MKKIFSLFAALTLSAGLWAAAPANVESVDLGLPSGLKWATFNVGATAPEGNGDYFAWGETSTKTTYDWSTYFDTNDDGSTFTKYNLTGGLTTLEPEDDAATANWGSDWRMPTKAEQDELLNNCTWTWTTDYNNTGIKGYIVTSKAEGNTNSIFLPASGCRDGSSLDDVGTYGYYWSSSLNERSSREADYLDFGSDNVDWYYNDRYYGQSVRAVTTKSIVPAKTSVITYTAEEKLTEVTGKYDGGLHLNAFYAADSTQLTATHTFDQGTGTITLNGELAIIGDDAFYTCTSLQSITIPEGVTTIGVEAFYGCQSLQSITLPAGLTTIGEYAFYSCLSLESVNMPASVTTIGQRAFYYCVALQSLILPENLTKIEMMTFVSTGLTSITIPAGVTEIGMGAFAECAGLTSVTFLGNACQNNIGEMAFYNVGNPDPALLTLPNSWTGSKPDEDGNWYGGKFEMSSDPTGWGNVNVNADVNKFFYNGQLIIRKNDKLYNAVGAEL